MDSLFGSREREAKELTKEIEATTNVSGQASNERAANVLEAVGAGQGDRGTTGAVIGRTAIGSAMVESFGRDEDVVKNTETEVERTFARDSGDGGENKMPSEQEILRSNQIVKEMVAAENGYSKDERLIGASLVGAESRLEVKQRTRDDDDDFKLETGEGWQHEILSKGQEKLTDETVKQIDRIIKKESYNPRQLERERFLGMSAILATYGRKLGDRN